MAAVTTNAAALQGVKLNTSSLADTQVLTYDSASGTWMNKASASGFSNPMTTAGDIIYGGASGTPTRLAAGTDGYVLTLASGVPSWAAASGGGGGTAVPQGIHYVDGSQNGYWSTSVSGGGTATFANGNKSLKLNTGGASGASVDVNQAATFTPMMRPASFKNPKCSAGLCLSGTAAGSSGNCYYSYFANNAPASSMNTKSRVGWDIIKTSGTVAVWAACADGTTETKTDITSSLSISITFGLQLNAVLTSGTSVKYYENGTLLATHATNLPLNGTSDWHAYRAACHIDASTADAYALDIVSNAIQYDMY